MKFVNKLLYIKSTKLDLTIQLLTHELNLIEFFGRYADKTGHTICPRSCEGTLQRIGIQWIFELELNKNGSGSESRSVGTQLNKRGEGNSS